MFLALFVYVYMYVCTSALCISYAHSVSSLPASVWAWRCPALLRRPGVLWRTATVWWLGCRQQERYSEVADLGSRWLCWSMWRGLCLMGAHMSRLLWSYAHLDIASRWHPLESPVIEWTSRLTVCGNISHIHNSTPYAYLPSWEMIGSCTLCACLSTGQFIKWGVSHWPAKGFHLTHQGDPAQLPGEPLSSGSAQTGTTAALFMSIVQYLFM